MGLEGSPCHGSADRNLATEPRGVARASGKGNFGEAVACLRVGQERRWQGDRIDLTVGGGAVQCRDRSVRRRQPRSCGGHIHTQARRGQQDSDKRDNRYPPRHVHGPAPLTRLDPPHGASTWAERIDIRPSVQEPISNPRSTRRSLRDRPVHHECQVASVPRTIRMRCVASQSTRRARYRTRLNVELRGLEPLTPCMPCRCATSCATAPDYSSERV